MKTFDCDEARRCLDGRDAGTLEADEDAALDVHMAVCEDCRSSAALFERVGETLQQAPLPPLSPELEARLLSGDPVLAPADESLVRWVVVAAAAVFALFLLWPNSPPPPSPVVEAPPSPTAAPPAQPAPFVDTLPGATDGTALYLAAGAEVDVITNTAAEARFRLRRGHVVALVGSNAPGFRFTVETPEAAVVAKGTIFAVTVPDDGSETYRVVEGTVDVVPNGAGERRDLNAGRQRAGVGADDANAERDDLLADLELARWSEGAAQLWVDGLLAPSPEPPRTAPAGPSVDTLLRRARKHQARREFAEAEAVHQEILNRYRSRTAAWYSHVALGRLALRGDRPEEALGHFERYLSRAPAGTLSEEARLGRLRSLVRLGRDRDVAAAANEYLQRHPQGRGAAEVREAKASSSGSGSL